MCVCLRVNLEGHAHENLISFFAFSLSSSNTMDDQLISLSKVIARLPDHVTVQGSIAEAQNAPRLLLQNADGAARVPDVRNPKDLAALLQVVVPAKVGKGETVVMDETGEFFFHMHTKSYI